MIITEPSDFVAEVHDRIARDPCAQQLRKAPLKITFAGSNPPCSASQCGLHYAISACVRTAVIPAG